MTCLLWLPSRPQSSFKISTSPSPVTDNANNLYLIPLNNADILVLYHTQIIQLDSTELTVKEEILLESPIEAFKFDPETFKLTLKLSETLPENHSNFDAASEIITVTGKNCTWSLDCPLRTFTLTFSDSGAMNCCLSADEDSRCPQSHQPVLEVIRNEYVASLTDPSKLQLLHKSDRSVISSTSIPKSDSEIICESIIWIDEDIFVFKALNEHFQILKYSLIRTSSPTNGCNWPLVTWSNELINVHRAGAICPTWYKLKKSEVWDVLNSPVGNVQDVKISLDGSCLLVCGSIGIAFCDFETRNWKSLPIASLLCSRWLGNSHVVALAPDNQQLLLISREGIVMKIPVEEASSIKFIDSYNNWQLLLQIPTEIIVMGFSNETMSFTLFKRIPFKSEVPLKQAAFFKDKLFTLNQEGAFLANNEPIMENCESFLVLSTGHFFITKSHDVPILWREDQIHSIEILPSQRILGVLPFTNCLTLLLSESINFSLHDPVQSRFLLPDLFATNPDETLLPAWEGDPLYQLALEYVLLKCLNNKDALECLDQLHSSNPRAFSLAIASLTRKVEFHEASQQLFAHLPTFTPLFVAKNIELDDSLIFLPYLAKSYFENVVERKEAITFILKGLFDGVRSYRGQIRKIRAYLSAFADLEELLLSSGKRKILSLWSSGRLLKAFDLLTLLGIEGVVSEIPSDKLDYFKVEKAIAPELVLPFLDWLATRGHPESVINSLKDS